MECLTIKNLNFAYADNDEFVLKNINLKILQGEFITLFGASGCGKTTLLRHLKPELAPAGIFSGEILFFGKDIQIADSATKLGFVQQNTENQIVCDKVWHEIAFGLESIGMDNEQMHKRVAEMASFFGIHNWLYQDVESLSGGQKQLLNLAAVMVMRPEILILDEPTAQLDPIGAETFLHMLKKINAELGTTILISEHRLEETIPLSDKIIAMEQGEILVYDTPKNAAKWLRDNKRTMFSALPTPMRVYAAVENDLECPLDVKEGREWLLKRGSDDVTVIPKKSEEIIRNTASVITLKGVHFRYEKKDTDVLKDVTFSVRKGEIYAIAGGNGTGKSTLLKIISGIKKHYQGKVLLQGKVSLLPQNPQSVFTKKTLIEDFKLVSSDSRKIRELVTLFGIEKCINRHPFDLSGGEQQRAAIVKTLLTNPDILLLDEPTKGMDSAIKAVLTDVLHQSKKNGMTIVMVSHDVEFCAKTADRCALFFDGKVTAEGNSRQFFSGNAFYTTAASRMSRGILDDIVTAEELIETLGGVVEKQERLHTNSETILLSEHIKAKEKMKVRPVSVVLLLIFALCVAVQFFIPTGMIVPLEIVMAGCLLVFFLNLRTKEIQITPAKKRGKSSIFFSVAVVLFLIPLTVLAGVYLLDDRKYYFISILVILEILALFIVRFEQRKPKAREIVLLAVLIGISVGGRMAFYMLPHFKPTLAIIMICGIAFGGETGFLVGALSAFVSNMFFGQGPWTPWQMMAMGLSGYLAGIFFRVRFIPKSKPMLTLFGMVVCLGIYGVIVNISSAVVWEQEIQFTVLLSYIAMGFPFDLIHSLSTAFFMWVLSAPILHKLERMKIKYDLFK